MREIPIDPKLLGEARAAFQASQDAANKAGEIGLALVKVWYALGKVAPRVAEAEDAARDQLIRLCLANGVAAEDYAGVDFDRGMLQVKEKDSAA